MYTTLTTMRQVLSAVPLALTLLWASAASAYDPPAAGPADDATLARSWFAEGVLAEKAGQTDKACEAFRAALLLRRAPQVAGKLVTCLQREGRPWEAADLALYALTDESAPASERARLEGLLAELRKGLGWIRVEVDRIGADVFLAGRHVGRSPFPRVLHVAPGRVVVRAEILDQGKHETEATLDVQAGAESAVTLRLMASAPTAPTASPAAPAQTPPPATANAAPPRAGRSMRDLGIVAGITVTSAAVITGGALMGLHVQALDEADEFRAEVDRTTGRCPIEGKVGPCRDLYNALVRSDDLGNAGVGAFVTAGVIGAATLGLWLATDGEDAAPSSGLVVSPLAGREVAGLVVGGRLP